MNKIKQDHCEEITKIVDFYPKKLIRLNLAAILIVAVCAVVFYLLLIK